MGQIKDAIKKIARLPGIKIFCMFFIVGVTLLVGSKYFDDAEKSVSSTEKSAVTYSEQEEKLAEILSQIDGVGEVQVMITTKDKTSSVLVVAENADDPAIRLKIRQAVRTIVQTDNKNIKIIKKQS